MYRHALLLACTVLCVAVCAQNPYENNLAKTPPMGWNSWNCCGGGNETLVKAVADAIATNGMQAAGYQFVTIDDGWATTRDAQGNIGVNATLFPSGIKALADYVHSKGLKFGIYTSRGTTTCGGAPGSAGYETVDAQQYAAWGVDFVKADGCGANENAPSVIAQALLNTGRPIVLSVNTWSYGGGVDTVANMWRIRNDLGANWASIADMIDVDVPLAPVATPGHWNDPDMLQVGNGTTLSLTENKSHFAMWCMLAAPLLAGNDVRTMSASILGILTHSELIAIDQDSLGYQAQRIAKNDSLEVWVKVLRDSSRAVALLNRGATTTRMSFSLPLLGWPTGLVCPLRDVWNKTDIGTISDSFGDTVPSHGTVVYRVYKGPDMQGPRITGVFDDTTFAHVFVVFDEPVQAASAQIATNYTLDNGATVTGAVLQPGSRSVLLTTSALTSGRAYTLSVTNVRDQSANTNPVAPGTQALFTVAPHAVQKLTGTVFGAGDPFNNDPTVAYTAAVDGNLATYSDLTSHVPLSPLYVGYDLGAGVSAVVTAVAYAPRNSLYASRMVGMHVQGSNDQSSWTTLLTITTAPPAGVLTRQAVASIIPYRSVRLEGTAGFLNVAEIEFYGYETGTTTVGALAVSHVRMSQARRSPRLCVIACAQAHEPAALGYAVYTLCGARVYAGTGTAGAARLPSGVYVVRPVGVAP